jgi:WD40 repeat protein
MGTSAATVLVYSIMQLDLITIFGMENSPRITCLVWIKSAYSLYAVGESGTVSLFSIPKQCLVGTIKHTQDPVYSMAQNKDGSTLAMGSRNIHICDYDSDWTCQPSHQYGDCWQLLVL